MATVNLPDGRQINFPDTMSTDEIRGIVRERLGIGPSAPPRPAEPAPAVDTTGVFGAELPKHDFSQKSFGEPLRPTFEAVGGTAGSIIGGTVGGMTMNPAGPVVGSIVGGGVGTAAGGVAYDAYRDVRRLFADDPSIPPSAGERLSHAAQEGLTDAAISTGVGGIPAVARTAQALGRKVLGIRPEGVELAREAERRGIGLGPADVVDEHGAPRAYVNVFGRMPWFGGPARVARDRKINEWIEHRDRYFGVFAPPEHFADVSRAVSRSAERMYDGFRTEASRLYGEAKTLADQAGPIFPTDMMKKEAEKRANELSSGVITLLPIRDPATGKMVASGTLGNANATVNELLHKLTLLPPKINATQLDALDTEIERTMNKISKEYGYEFKELNDVRRVGEATLRTIASSEPAAAALKAADDFFERGIKTFQTPVGQKFGKVNKNMFRPGMEKAGTLNEDELLRVVVNSRSPESVTQLTDIVGPRTMQRVARTYIDNAYQAARGATEAPIGHTPLSQPMRGERAGDVVFSVEKFAHNLGLDRPQSNEYETTRRMLQTAGVDIHDMRRFIEVTKSVLGNEIPDASTYVARRGTIAGIRSILTAVSPGVTLETFGPKGSGVGFSGALLGLMAARYVTHLMTDPTSLKRLINAYQPGVSVQQRNMALVRLVRKFGETDDELMQAAFAAE